MSKVVGFVVGAALIVAGALTGNIGLIIQGGAMIVTQAVVNLTAPKTPARQASEMSLQLGEQPRCLMVGEAGTPGSLVDGFNHGGKYGTDWEVLVIRLADHKCDSLVGFFVNDEYVPYTGNGNYPQFDGSHFELYFRADTTTEPLPDVIIDEGPGWVSTDIGESGCDVTVCYRSDPPDAKKPAWPGGRPRFYFVLRGALCYDPRLDDTVTGGAGPHRIDDPDTWEWSENAAICRYKWVRGVYANDDSSDPAGLLIGRGLTAEEAPPENIIAAANLCDEMVGEHLPYETYAGKPPGLHRLWGFTFSSDFTKFISQLTGDFEVWDVRARSLLAAGTFTSDFDSHVHEFTGLGADGTVYLPNDARTAIMRMPDFGRGAPVLHFATGTAQEDCQVRLDGDGDEHVCTIPYSSFRTFYVDGVAWDPDTTGATWGPQCFCTDAYGDIWAVGSRTSAFVSATQICFWRVVDVSGRSVADFAAVTVTGSPSGGSPLGALHHGASGRWVVSWNLDTFYAIDDTTFAIDLTAAANLDVYNHKKQFANYQPGQPSLWLNSTGQYIREIDLATLATLRTLDMTDWLMEDADGVVYSPVNHGLICGPQLTDAITFRWLDRNGSYRVAGPIYSNQDFITVESMFAVAAGGTTITVEGSVELEPGHAKSVVEVITDADLLTGSKVSWNNGFLSEANPEWVNTTIGNYVEPEQKWNPHNTEPLRDPADIIADGRTREAQVTMRLVRYREQALRITEIHRRLGRLWGRASIKLGPRFCHLEAGDWIQWQSDRYFAGATRTFRIEAYGVDEKWQVQLTLREIAGSVFADDGDFAQDLSRPAPVILPVPIGTPDAGNWTLTPTTVDSAGASAPALVIGGTAADDESVEAIIVEYWLDDGVLDPVADPDGIPWIMVGRYPPTTEEIEITGVAGGSTYYVALTYVVSGIPGERLVIGPETVAEFTLAGSVTTSGLTMNTGKLLGRSTASVGAIEEITVGSGLSLAGGVLANTGGGGGGGSDTYLQAGSNWAGRYLPPDTHNFGTAAVSFALGLITYYAFSKKQPIQGVAIEVTTGAVGSNIRLGLYESDANGLPKTLVYDSGDISSASTGIKDFIFGATYTPTGPYWVCVLSSHNISIRSGTDNLNGPNRWWGASVINNAGTGLSRLQQTQAYGALPADTATAGAISLVGGNGIAAAKMA